MAILCFILGVIAFLVMEHTVVFWCIFVPLAIIFVVSLIAWFTGRGLGLSRIMMAAIALFLMIAVLVAVCVPDEPEEEHEHGKIFSFVFQGSTAKSSVRPWCKSGDCYNLGYTLFNGTPDDLSYLELIKECCNADEIVPGEYYTMSVKVSQKFYNPSFSQRISIDCRIESDDIVVDFNVEFREEFREQVKSIQEGDIITFRGRYYDEGCGFTDCELIIE